MLGSRYLQKMLVVWVLFYIPLPISVSDSHIVGQYSRGYILSSGVLFSNGSRKYGSNNNR